MRRLATSRDVPDFNDLNDDVVVEVDVEEALKSSIFIVQKAAAPKSGVEFRQDSIGTIRNSLSFFLSLFVRRQPFIDLLVLTLI